MGWHISVESEETARQAPQVFNRKTGKAVHKGPSIAWFPGAQKTRELIIRLGTPIDHIVAQIIACKPKNEFITILRLGSHGDAGGISLGGEDHVPLVFGNADCFKALREHFQPPRGVIQIHSCGVASDETIVAPGTKPKEHVFRPGRWKGPIRPNEDLVSRLGYRLLSRLAEVTGVPVTAPFNAQSQYANSLKGPQLWVYPDGDYVKL